jgi:hypothetical protein
LSGVMISAGSITNRKRTVAANLTRGRVRRKPKGSPNFAKLGRCRM